MSKDFVRPGRLLRHSWAAPLGLAILAVLAYGVHIPYMGVYWDDWPKLWVAHISGGEAMRWLFLSRPFSGIFLATGFAALGENIAAWHWLGLIMRLGATLAAWWLLRIILQRRAGAAFAVGAILLVWPGFRQQFIPISYSPHFLALLLFMASFILTAQAARAPSRQPAYTLGALLLALCSMFTSEYFYGIEPFRLLVIWLALQPEQRDWRRVSLRWTPYLLILFAVFAWRWANSQRGGYDIILPTDLVAQAVVDSWRVFLEAWTQTLQSVSQLEGRVLLYALAFGGAGAAVSYLVLLRAADDGAQAHCGFGFIAIGLLAMLLGDWPARVAGLVVNTGFPADRLTLPLMIGAGLVLAGALTLIRPSQLRAGLLALLLGLAVAFHFANALTFRVETWRQAEILQQLVWRVPGLMEGTTVTTQELPTLYTTDNSFTAPLNWMYAPDFGPTADDYRLEEYADATLQLPLIMRYLDLRLGWQVPLPGSGEDYEVSNYANLRFEGNEGESLLIYYQEPYCLQVLHHEYSSGHPHLLGAEFYAANPHLLDRIFNAEFPQFPEESIAALPFADWERILLTNEAPDLPEVLRDFAPSRDWCFYFEQADLARQRGDWQQAAELGRQAEAMGFRARHASEWVPFIEAYAHLGDWASALDLTGEALVADPAMQTMLCATWQRVADDVGSLPFIWKELEALDCAQNLGTGALQTRA